MGQVTLGPENYKITDKQMLGWKLLTNPQYKFIKFWGGSRSGKTFLNCLYIVLRAYQYAGSQHIVCRYDKQKAKNTVWRQTLEPILRACERAGWCRINNGEQYAKFTNGSMVILAGLRPTDVGNILSAEYATFFCCEANEMAWETIDLAKSRLNSNAKNIDGKIIECKFLIDLNPTFDRHWSNRVWIKGINPETNEPLNEFDRYAHLWFEPSDNKENLSESFMDTLKSMTGSRRRRFWEGQYGTYEGLVYSNFDDERHIVDDFQIPHEWLRIRVIDFGFSKGHAFVCLWIALDPSNERVIVYREYVKEGVTVRIHAQRIHELSEEDGYYEFEEAVCDHDAEDRATLEENGIPTKPADKTVLAGIDKMLDFIDRDKFHVFRSCTETISELGSYIWKIKDAGFTKDREVVKDNDNCMDCCRYGLMELFPINIESEVIPI